jgi:hypothetical protein
MNLALRRPSDCPYSPGLAIDRYSPLRRVSINGIEGSCDAIYEEQTHPAPADVKVRTCESTAVSLQADGLVRYSVVVVDDSSGELKCDRMNEHAWRHLHDKVLGRQGTVILNSI